MRTFAICLPAAAGALFKQGGSAVTAGVVSGRTNGFDYTRICNSGEAQGTGSCPDTLTAPGTGPNDWGCTRETSSA